MKTYNKEVLKNLYEDCLTERERRRIAQQLKCAYDDLYNQDAAELHIMLQRTMRGC